MYEGIFEDVQVVKEVLASHGHKSVDETLVFELLEDLKVKDQVVKVLLGTNLRRTADSPICSSRSGASNDSSQGEARFHEADESLYYSNSSYSSDELEILDDIEYRAPTTMSVDLTMEENHARPDSPIVEKELKNQSIVEITQESDQVGAQSEDLIDFAEKVQSDGRESPTIVEAGKEEPVCVNGNLRDIFDATNEDADATNSATESEDVEMDDYYIRPDIESEESNGFGGSDGKVSIPSSPISRMQADQSLVDLIISNHYKASNLEPADNRMEEMLEENNNDPNNNLEDIQVMEQNNVSSTIVDDLLNSNKGITAGEKCVSPKPGCSKDSYYADSDVCIVQKSNDKPSCGTSAADTENLLLVENNETNRSKNRSSFHDPSQSISYQNLNSDLELITKVLPNTCSSYIRTHLMKNYNAINRIELVLWDLLPEKRPQPILSAKRKQETDDTLSPMKKFVSDEFHPTANAANFPATREELPQAPASLHSKMSIIKPAKLNIPPKQTNILHPPNLPSFSEYRSSTSTSSARSSNSTTKLKPSSLQFVSSAKLKLDPHHLKNPKTSHVTSTQDKITAMLDSDEANPVLEKQPLPTAQSLPSIDIKKLETNLAKLNPQVTGAIPKAYTGYGKKTKAVSNNPPSKSHEPGSLKLRAGTESSASRPSSSGSRRLTTDAKSRQMVMPDMKSKSREWPQQDSKLKKPNKTLANLMNNMLEAFEQTNRSPTKGPILENVKYMTQAQPAAKAPEKPTANREDIKLPRVKRVTQHDLDEIFRDLERFNHSETEALNLEVEKRVDHAQPAAKAPEEPIANPWAENSAATMQVASKTQQAVKVREKDAGPPKELFNPLINMFPDVDPAYITDLCIDAQLTKKNLESLVEILLVKGLEYPRIVNPEPEPDVNPDTQYENLQGIFPDAHPKYLREMAEQYYNNPEAMKDFVQSQLENPDYPTMADYLKKIKITEQIKQYTVDFKPEKFLEIFPDPFKHFENAKRVHRFNVIAFEFLKCHFKGNKVATIQRVYRHINCHLSLAAKELERIGPDMKSRRGDKMLPTEDIPLLQEFSFLQHKAEIKEYMKQQRLNEKAEFKRLKESNELVECQCCFDGECMPSKCSTCSEGHIFCNSCIKLGSATKIGEGRTQFPCFVDCKGEFTLPVLQNVLEPTTFSILLRKRQEEEVKAAGLEGLVSCPFCHFASIPPPEDKVFKCLNPECMKESCRFCKELNHVPLRCDELTKGEEALHLLEEKMTEALVRKCYKCLRPFFKDEGCNKMTCPCGASTCYICGQRVKDYSHFNGQGSDRVDLCPLWSDNKVLNAQTVRVVAEAAEKELLKNNPHLKIDAKALMPALPQSSKGPHQDIANAHVLPVHTRRV